MASSQLTTTARRRTLGMGAGQSLLLPDSALGTVARATQFLDFSGLPPQDVLTTPLMGMPVPMATRIPAGRRRWWGTRVEAMWHPLMWLPRRLATRAVVRDSRGRPAKESFHDWSARVALELEGAAVTVVAGKPVVRLYEPRKPLRLADTDDSHLQPIYDPATGTWLDVLAAVGIDIDSRDGKAQVAAWLDGYPHPALDGLDLDRFLVARGRNPHWASGYLQARLKGTSATRSQVLRAAAAARAGREIAGQFDRVMYTVTGQLPYEQARTQLASLAWLARTAIGSMGMDVPGAPWTTSQLVVEARRAYNQAAVYAVGRELRQLLMQVAEQYAGAEQQMADHAAAEHEDMVRAAGRAGRRGLRGLLSSRRA